MQLLIKSINFVHINLCIVYLYIYRIFFIDYRIYVELYTIYGIRYTIYDIFVYRIHYSISYMYIVYQGFYRIPILNRICSVYVVFKVRNGSIVVHSSLNVRQCCLMCDYKRI